MFSLLFPGQGSQHMGMAKELYDNFDYIKKLFEEADDLLKYKISEIIFEGPTEKLNSTQHTQPAIFLTSYSIYLTIFNDTNFDASKAEFFAGHSLGEYSALCCAESLNFKDTLLLLRDRGNAMNNAVKNGNGGMVAILGTDKNKVDQLLSDNQDEFKCYIANDNSPGQIVVSGELKNLELLQSKLLKEKIKNIKLPVSAPFHCPLMKYATIEMLDKIKSIEFKTPTVKVYSNVSATFSKDSNEIKKLLLEQIESPVRWREIIENMSKNGVNNFIEIGPGKVLSGLVKRIDRNNIVNQVSNLEDIKRLNLK